MPTLEEIRDAAERDIQEAMTRLDQRHRELLRLAIQDYGSVRNIPEGVWQQIAADTSEELAALLLLLMVNADEWTWSNIRDQTERRVPGLTPEATTSYSVQAARRAADYADRSTDAIRRKLQTKVSDAQLGRGLGFGDLGELTQEGLDKALDEIFTKERRDGAAADQTTHAITDGQRGAGNRAKQVVTVEMRWQTERDNKVCPRCSPLHETPEEVWSRVFYDGPGEAAHPNCRCWLRPVVVVEPDTQ